MKILLTGASGFFGKHILQVLNDTHQLVETVGRHSSDHYRFDLAKNVPVFKSSFDVVVHAAGKAHVVPRTESEIKEFYNVNVTGTLNLLEGLTPKPPSQIVFISSVSVYGCETGNSIDEDSPLNGKSPYATSKIEAEQVVLDWAEARGVFVLILRLPLIAGTNPPGNLGKMIKGIRRGLYFSIAKGKARRSVVLASDVGYCILNNFQKQGVFNLTDGYHPSFRELEGIITKQLGKSIPFGISERWAKVVGRIGDLFPWSPVKSSTIDKMINDLTFDDSKARRELKWEPRKVIDHFMMY